MAIAGQSAEQQPDLIIMGYVGNDWINEAIPRHISSFSSPSFAMNFIVTSLTGEPPLWKPYKEYPFAKPTGLPASYTLMSKLGKKTPTLVVMDSRYESELSSHRESEKLFQTLGMKTINLLEEWNQQAKGRSGYSAVRAQNTHNRNYLIANDFHPNQKWHEKVAKRIYEELTKHFCQD